MTYPTMLQPRFTRTCFKKRYPTKKDAKAWVPKVNKLHKLNVLGVYYCDECQGWHHTSMEKPLSRDYGRVLNGTLTEGQFYANNRQRNKEKE